MSTENNTKYVETIVIGGGQAGLSVGYHLKKRGLRFVILDASKRVGDAWRNRWDSLRLFTPARYAGLPGLAFPARGDSFPTKEGMAGYLESYAERFGLPVRSGTRVQSLSHDGQRFKVQAGEQRYEAGQVVVAMANYQRPKVPAFARDLDRGILQLHSHQYRNPSQLQDGGVLVVGSGNSGADIGIEVARTHRTWMSGKESGTIPFFHRQRVLALLHVAGFQIYRAQRFDIEYADRAETAAENDGRGPADPCEAGGFDQGGDRASAKSRRRAEWTACVGGRAGLGRCSECDLVHRIPHRLFVDRPTDFWGKRRAGTRSGGGEPVAGNVLRRVALFVCDDFGDGYWCGEGCGEDCEGD
jgi:Pyridine nucleotide-disulphide oxidoreductase